MDFIRTNDTVTEAELRALFSINGEEPPTPDVVETHDGDWRREVDRLSVTVWRFWEIEDL